MLRRNPRRYPRRMLSATLFLLTALFAPPVLLFLLYLVAYSERRSIIELFVGLDGNEAPTNAQGAVTWIGMTPRQGKNAVRRNLLDGRLPDNVSNDLHYGLGAVTGGSGLVFEPEAIARIGRPARDFRHEFARRRRVTCRGLSTLRARRELLDPRRHGRFAIALMVNKLFRRLACPAALLAALILVAALLTLPVSAADILPAPSPSAFSPCWPCSCLPSA